MRDNYSRVPLCTNCVTLNLEESKNAYAYCSSCNEHQKVSRVTDTFSGKLLCTSCVCRVKGCVYPRDGRSTDCGKHVQCCVCYSTLHTEEADAADLLTMCTVCVPKEGYVELSRLLGQEPFFNSNSNKVSFTASRFVYPVCGLSLSFLKTKAPFRADHIQQAQRTLWHRTCQSLTHVGEKCSGFGHPDCGTHETCTNCKGTNFVIQKGRGGTWACVTCRAIENRCQMCMAYKYNGACAYCENCTKRYINKLRKKGILSVQK